MSNIVRNACIFVACSLPFSSAFAAEGGTIVDSAVTKITTDGTAAITAVGSAMLGLAGIAIVFKWAKASIFG